MPLTIHLTDDATTIDMDAATDYVVLMDGGNLGLPMMDRLWGQSAMAAYDALIRSIRRNRTVSLSLKILDSSHDNWIANLQNLQRMISEGERFWASSGYLGTRCYLDIALAGATNTTRFDVLAGEVDPGHTIFSFPLKSTTAPQAIGVGVNLHCKPGGRPSSSTSNASASLTNNANPHTVTPVGDIDTPCKVTFAPDAAIDFRFLWIYRRSLGTPSDFLSRIECEPGTFTNEIGTSDYVVTDVSSAAVAVTTTVDAAASSGERAAVAKAGAGTATNENVITCELTSNLATQYGKHRVLLRVRRVTGAAVDVQWRLTYGGSVGTSRTPNAAVNNTATADPAYGLVDLGYIVIPWPEVPSDVTITSYKFTLQVTYTATAWSADLDCFYLIPQTHSDFLYVDLTAVSAAQDKFVSDLIDPRPRAYYTNSAGAPLATLFDLKEHTFFTAQRGKAQIFVPIWADDANKKHVLADTAVLTVEHFPKFETMR